MNYNLNKQGCVMKKLSITIVTFLLIVLLTGCGKKQPVKIPSNEAVGEFAPPNAYLSGSKHPYYGSENAWDIGGNALESRFFSRDPQREYKRRGQKALLLTIAGKPELAEKYCRKLLSKDSEDLESYFNLAVALAQQNKIDEAVKTVKTAVDMGLPLGRFLAGPRDLLKPLVESKGFKDYAAPFKLEVIQGPMLGRVSDHGTSFWVRTFNEVNVQVKVSKHKSLKNAVFSDVAKTDSNKDYTAIVKVEKLEPNTLYYYEVLVNGSTSDNTVTHSFRTFPKADKRAKFKVAYGGGGGYVPWHERIWDVIKGHQPLAFLWMGDNVYINTPHEPDNIHYSYYVRQSRLEFRRLVSSVGNYEIWDYHDAATDGAWLGPFENKPAWKMLMLVLF